MHVGEPGLLAACAVDCRWTAPESAVDTIEGLLAPVFLSVLN